ncbi:MAG: hypothetical protein JNJ65_12245 [Cyclobacteriaceae bacterium]|nr:hypothetical protein [Cyclobacteriaceae bacterium]
MKLITTLFLALVSVSLHAQDVTSTMEKRAREMARVISVNDPAAWKKFVLENYTQALIDKPMRATVNENGGTSTTTATESTNLDAKVKLFERLHNDFGDHDLVSINTKDQQVEMVLLNSQGLRGTFKLTFEKTKPYLISGLGIEAGN